MKFPRDAAGSRCEGQAIHTFLSIWEDGPCNGSCWAERGFSGCFSSSAVGSSLSLWEACPSSLSVLRGAEQVPVLGTREPECCSMLSPGTNWPSCPKS